MLTNFGRLLLVARAARRCLAASRWGRRKLDELGYVVGRREAPLLARRAQIALAGANKLAQVGGG